MTFRVLTTRRLLPEAESALRRAVSITRAPRLAEAVIVQLTDRVDAAFLDRFPRARCVSQCAVGVDNIDLAAAARRGITVMNTPGVLTEATADLTWALILAVARRVPEGDRIVRRGAFPPWDLEFLLGMDLQGRTLGVVGAGRIGTAVARRAAGFGMRVIYCRRRRGAAPPARGMRRVGFATLLKRADVVSIHVPATPRTHHLIDRRALARMKPGAILINTARGACVDERALLDALRRGRLGGAGLDVFEREPRVPAPLRRLENVVLTPHIASATHGTRAAMALTAARNVVDFLRGRPDPRHIVRP